MLWSLFTILDILINHQLLRNKNSMHVIHQLVILMTHNWVKDTLRYHSPWLAEGIGVLGLSDHCPLVVHLQGDPRIQRSDQKAAYWHRVCWDIIVLLAKISGYLRRKVDAELEWKCGESKCSENRLKMYFTASHHLSLSLTVTVIVTVTVVYLRTSLSIFHSSFIAFSPPFYGTWLFQAFWKVTLNSHR